MSTAGTEAAETDVTGTEAAETESEQTEATGARRDIGRLSWGRLAVALLVAEALTGLILMFHYRPTVDSAHLDLVDLREVSRFGFVRSLHRWGAHAAVILVWLHLFRVALRGAYAVPRRRDWAVGVVLMVLTLLLAATGYLLPWDQDAFWSLAVLSPAAANAAAGDSVLLRIYVSHCVALPLLVAGLTAYHLRCARRDPEPGPGSFV